VAAGSVAAGCVATIVPPPAPRDPRPVFVLDHGRTTSLVLPAAGDGIVRYAYGDWNYYAERRTSPFRGTSAVLFPTRGALGRRELAGPADEAAVRRQVRVPSETVLAVWVGSGEIDRLREDLDGVYRANLHTRLFNEVYDLEFVEHPKSYWAFHNSNQIVATWLAHLGCEVRGTTLFASWRVAAADRPGSP
jgi:hypothetical protein